MKKIDGKPRSLRELLSKRKYKVHYYQREYRWQKKQIEELIEDLTSEFFESHSDENERKTVSTYSHYFMGSVVLSKDGDETAIIDGQQRLTSFTLLLIYLHHLQTSSTEKVEIKEMIFSEKYGEKSFNIDVPERVDCMDQIFKTGLTKNINTKNESVKNLVARYEDIEELFPSEIKNSPLPFFIDWLIENVDFIEISAETEQDAHKIFVSMNDRGLSLTPTEMLKGYLLSEIADNNERLKAEKIWKKKIFQLNELGKEEDSDFLKTWLRAQYAETIRETRRDAEKKDFDLISNEFHKWVRENKSKLNLVRSQDFESFIKDKFVKFSDLYVRLFSYSNKYNEEYPHVFYNANRNFTFQNQVILASIDPEDDVDTINSKIKLVSIFLDYYISIRVFNFKTLTYSSIRNYIFNLTKKIRAKTIDEIKDILLTEIDDFGLTLDGVDKFYLNQYTKRFMLHILARITSFIEEKSDVNTSFEKYVLRDQKNPYDIEHILADNYSIYSTEFIDEDEFSEQRNKFGALLILPSDKNRSFQDEPYSKKLKMYLRENLLAQSLHKDCYSNNPRFIKFKDDSSLPFTNYDNYGKTEIKNRQDLYKELCKMIWNKINISDFN